MSTFSGLNTAFSGIQAHKRTIDMIGHNVANVETEGFSRRRVDLSPSGSIQPPGRYSTFFSNSNLGVDVTGVRRIRDGFLEAKARAELGNQSAQTRNANVLGRVENVFPEPSDLGVQAQLAKFWNSWADAANDPASLPARTAVLEQAKQLSTTLRKAAGDLTTIRTDLTTELNGVLAQVNADAQRVAELNAQIRLATVGGSDPSDLADQRDLLIDKITKSVGGTARAGRDGMVDVILGGSALVSGDHVEQIAAAQTGTLSPPLDTLPLQQVQIRWARDGYPVLGYGGDVGGIVAGANDTVPRYMADLNTIASTMVSTVNALHTTGKGLNQTADVNLNFFDPSGTTAATIAVSSDVAGQPSRLALANATAGALDITVANALSALGTSPTGADTVHRNMMGRLGIEAGTATSRATLQESITRAADADRKSVSGVNIDEEMTQLIQSQRAYEASARLMTTIDEMLDVIINRTGIVGR